MMLGESNQKSYNITLKNVVQTTIKIVTYFTKDSKWLPLLWKWRHRRLITLDVRAPCVPRGLRDGNQPMKTHDKIDIYLCHCSVQPSSGLTKLFT